ncbi:uncharacterized protein FIBRA_09392 [Fibroporia radiculosa]|uniref:Uncharacterized protein n=1 Tax=Fibroporia radiculosa TaxID=599839 RepID=J7S6E7_9APHY|nr:uncharacterized protein FIBRA_09392 [Fibroporia radiculosa]CCM07069.1 predicted protein [Fibroporia radiculosa]
MASITILAALLILTWFLVATLILILTLAFFHFKETYKVEVILPRQPTTPIIDQTPEWPAEVQVTPPVQLIPTSFTDLCSALLGLILMTLLSVLTLALIVPLLLHLTIQHLEREHQWAFNIAATAQRPLLHTTTTLPIIAANHDSNNPMQKFLDEGDFQYPFTPPLSNITCHPFLIPGSLDSSNSNAVVLSQFPGPLEIPHTSDASIGSYHVAPAQIFPSSLPINTSSSPNPDSPTAASTNSPTMPPLAFDVSDNGSLDHAPNLQLLVNVTEYITALEGYSSDPQVLQHWRGGSFSFPNYLLLIL